MGGTIENAFPAAHVRGDLTLAASRQACCSSLTSIGYWCCTSLLAWGGLSLIGIYWYPLHGSAAATVCLAVAIGCIVNWLKNRTLHCGITAPLFAIAGTLFLLSDMRLIAIAPAVVWLPVAVVTGLSFLLEWHATRTRHNSTALSRQP
jgi:hypothetical protein